MTAIRKMMELGGRDSDGMFGTVKEEPPLSETASRIGWKDFKLVLVGPLPPPSAGMANQTEQLGRLLRAEGMRLRVVATNAPYRPAWVRRTRGLRAAVRLGSYLLALRQAVQHAQIVHVMANSGWAWHLNAAPAIWAARLAGVPVVVNYRGGGAERFFARSFAWVRLTLARADTVVVPSGFLEGLFRNRGVAAQVVPNVVDLERFNPAPQRSPRSSPNVIIARNLERVYDIPTGLRAFSALQATFPGARLTIAGTGPVRADLERLTTQLGVADAVRFTGPLDNARMSELYRSADLMLNPSRVDNTPISILEAFACGVPVVSTDVGGVPFIIEHGRTGLLVAAGDPEAMAEAASKILREPELHTTLREAGLEAAVQYTWPAVRQRLLAVYGNVIRRKLAFQPSSATP